MADFQTVCRVSDLTENEGKTVEVGNKLLALFRTPSGIYAIDDVCPHMGASLSGGWVENGVVTCPWHAWRFRVEDGSWTVNAKVKVPTYNVRVQGDEVQVEVPLEKNNP